MTTETLTRGQLNHATLARQMLLARDAVSPVAAIERLGCLQAQEAKLPFVGLWTRVAGFQRQDLPDALHGRAVVRATLLRGTLHLMSAVDYAALRLTLQPMLAQAMHVLGTRAAGLDLERLLPAARALLAERPRTFNALRPLLADAFPRVNDRALGYVVRTHLPLVMVPTEHRWGFPPDAEFALAERWLGAPLSTADAREALALRYLAAFGPASVADARAWSGMPGLKAVFEALRPWLRVFRDERGRELLDLPDAPRPDPDIAAPPRFLPEFDNLVLAHADRTRLLAEEHRGLVVTKNLRVRATFLWDGMVGGTWRVECRKKTATLHVTPFAALPGHGRAELVAEEEALLRFIEDDADVFRVKLGMPTAAA